MWLSARSALFPYTTLFRSRLIAFARDRAIAELVSLFRFVFSRQNDQLFGHEKTKDRKSTRLNSSHLGISYAVFCLKKKNDPHNALHGRARALQSDLYLR